MNAPILTSKKLSFGYVANKSVLNSISFDIHRGEFISILGQNGSGKSTLIKLLANRLKAGYGVIELNEKCVSEYSSKEFASLCGYLEQSPPTAEISLSEYVLHGAMPLLGARRFWFTQSEKKRAKELLADFELALLSDRMMTEISGGERQLAQICRAMMASPKLLLLDEPVSHLDIHHIDTVVRKLKELQIKNGITIVTILHDVNLAFSVSDRIFLVNHAGGIEYIDDMDCPDYKQFSSVFNTSFSLESKRNGGKKLLIPPYY